MLVLTRRREEMIYLDFSGMTDTDLLALRKSSPIKISVVDIQSDKVRIGFDAPRAVQVHRREIFDKRNPPG
jgi:sRNA-binding carbon storage regulator CsrA